VYFCEEVQSFGKQQASDKIHELVQVPSTTLQASARVELTL
jgi:hypothetical protein